ncbi:hypothetical protein [Bradyrhizobium sp. B120]|uniref:hypothetical protein n=1 Tax=Bradyrhizobium sp. B120 TaxID=3410088 RepID=UPI003B981CBB
MKENESLGATQWLWQRDDHIQGDYELLLQELRQSNPNLAARTRKASGGHGKRPTGINPEDAELIEWFKHQIIREGVTKVSAGQYASALRRLSRASVASGRPPFSARLHESALDQEASAVGLHVVTALNQLRTLKGVANISPQRRSDVVSPVDLSSSPEEHQVGASPQGRSGLLLGATDWLGDDHIQRDYELLLQELWQSNPNLAARTGLADPLMAFQVGQGSDDVALNAFHTIVNDRNGIDTADYLFLPVNNASTTDPNRRGSHWSFLLVDRTHRHDPVAYHYDSRPGFNAGHARQLARRLGAAFRNGGMREQENGFDCGVFVVDGTRALVQGLARGRRPAQLSLYDLVANREQLQIRLSSGQVAVAADRPGPSTQFVDPASSGSTWVRELPTPDPNWEQEFPPPSWDEGNQAGQSPADSGSTANFPPGPAYPPAESDPPPFAQSLGAAIFGATPYMSGPPELGEYVPQGWQHRGQQAPEHLMRGMHRYGVLPSADRPQTIIMIYRVPYAAHLGPSGERGDIYVVPLVNV